jgi:ATP-dependent helicase YprA (DUF1998 family)
MTLHPIRALDHVIAEYRDYLQTEFRAKDPALRAALERELDTAGFLAQEPFFQSHRPFKNGLPWRELPLDARLAAVMERRSDNKTAYIHQSEAIVELLSPAARSIVVTTGTGSGKTEAFLLPVIQNAFDDAVAFKKSGLTAILIYPMNALANDQKERIDQYLSESGIAGAIKVEQYDRSTSQAKRQEMRANPPHVLLTNYMMLEYLLIRPADREDIFANHRCRFLVLDEVHTYRGILGSNIALLVRRLKVHLARARQEWRPDVSDELRPRRYPGLVPVGTSATIKSLSEEALTREEIVRQRDLAVQEFFGTLAGVARNTIRVLGEELQEIQIPAESKYPIRPLEVDNSSLLVSDVDAVRRRLCRLAGLSETIELGNAARGCRLLWDLNQWLIRRPMSVSQLVNEVRTSVAERKESAEEAVRAEVETALFLGAALPDGTPGALRLRAHRFIRGGWKFYRCVNPDCGKLYPMGEERCSACNHLTAPLYLCRNCGADYLRMVGDIDREPLRPSADQQEGPEWLVYEPDRFDRTSLADDDDDDANGNGTAGTTGRPRRTQAQVPAQIKKRPVLDGSLDPAGLMFSTTPQDYRLKVTLVPARNRCLCCGGTAGSRNVLTPVSLGTSAAVKVVGEGLVEALAEANRDRLGHDGKERLLIFSDSRQDAAHQARFLIFAGRYDRMRRRLLNLSEEHRSLTIERAVALLTEAAVAQRDNPLLPEETAWIPDEARDRMQAWEEAPLLDDLSVNAGYRGTLFNLGVLGVSYHRLAEYIHAAGSQLAQRLGASMDAVNYICRVILDELRTRGALSRDMLRYHPQHVACPRHFQTAEWERSVKQPRGYALSPQGEVIPFLDSTQVPAGITRNNSWRRHGAGGRGPSVERLLKHLLNEFGGAQPDADVMVELLSFLKRGNFLVPIELFGFQQKCRLLQVNAEVVRIDLVSAGDRMRCEVCNDVRPGASRGMPCPRCHGRLERWPDSQVEANRHVRRLRDTNAIPLVAGEHTAQITNDVRAKLEEDFKAGITQSPINVLACSPTLEMGIDVGGLDGVILRNVPPRPDNYAQRGGRAGRRSRVGLVLGYARSTPHDQYFYDKPREMIAGEVPAPSLSLSNRDVIIRHLYAIVFGAAEPGIGGRMVDYVGPQGELKEESIAALIEGVKAKIEHTIEVARAAWGQDVLDSSGLVDDALRKCLEELPGRIRFVVESTAKQVMDLRQALEYYSQSLTGRYAGTRAGELVARLLGIQTESRAGRQDADDRSAGYPLRRFAEFGLLPGYEFPSEPASLRLLNDDHEEDPVSVTRRFGIGQFQPDAHVYARRRRWKVIGLDTASPWNPRNEAPTWPFRVCSACSLRYGADEPSCPRCRSASPSPTLPGFEFAGFLAKREERPILDEEDRFAVRNLVQVFPQWNGNTVGRWSIATSWALRLSRNENVRWINEGRIPSVSDLQSGANLLHRDAKGYLLCPSCGRILESPPPIQSPSGGRRNAANQGGAQGNNGHADSCPQRGSRPQPLAITTSGSVEVLRLLVPVPAASRPEDWQSWGLSLGYSLLQGVRHHFVLDAAELDFELEGPWPTGDLDGRFGMLSLAFIDPSLGGSGYLDRIAEQFHLVARRSIDHLNHSDCDTSCYRCLKSYQNQRFHDLLAWPQTMSSLEELAVSPPQRRPLETGDIDDPKPWLEAYAAGVGSPLELKFWKLFELHGFRPQKQVPLAPQDGQLAITVADFAVPERRLAIYVDGAAFHVGQNLRRDRFIRSRLRNGSPPWRVTELRARDLSRGRDLVTELIG